MEHQVIHNQPRPEGLTPILSGYIDPAIISVLKATNKVDVSILYSNGGFSIWAKEVEEDLFTQII